MKSSDASSHLFPLPFASNYVQNTINVYSIQQNIQLGELPAIEYLIRLKKKKSQDSGKGDSAGAGTSF